MQNEGKVRNCHTEDTNGKCENPRSYFCLEIDALRENGICSETQQAVGTHKGTVGEGELIYGGAGRRSNRAVPEAEQSPRGGKREAGKVQTRRPDPREPGPAGPGQEEGDSARRAAEGLARGAEQLCCGSGKPVTGGARGNGLGQRARSLAHLLHPQEVIEVPRHLLHQVEELQVAAVPGAGAGRKQRQQRQERQQPRARRGPQAGHDSYPRWQHRSGGGAGTCPGGSAEAALTAAAAPH